MGYFNLNNILYNFRKISKYLMLSLLLILFIVLCLILINKPVSAESTSIVVDSDNTYDYGNFNVSFTWLSEYSFTVTGTINGVTVNYTAELPDPSVTSSNYVIPFVEELYGSVRVHAYIVPKTSTFYAYNHSNNNWGYLLAFYCDSAYSRVWFGHETSNFTADYIEEINGYSSYALCDNFSDSTLNTLLFTAGSYTVQPLFLNAESSSWSNTLVTGNFNYFFIDYPSSETVRFIVMDKTLEELNDGLYENSYIQEFFLTPESSYRYLNRDGLYSYAISKKALKFNYKNNNDYAFGLFWDNDNITHQKYFYVTTDFSSSVISSTEQEQKDNMEQDLDGINDFLNDSSYSSSTITQNMPSSSSYSNPTDSGINNIFNTLRSAFTSDEGVDVVFTVPFTNGQTITLPHDIISSILPMPIILLIQSFYWYMICRFIIKDIAVTADKAKSGEILDSSDGNIKTDLL